MAWGINERRFKLKLNLKKDNKKKIDEHQEIQKDNDSIKIRFGTGVWSKKEGCGKVKK